VKLLILAAAGTLALGGYTSGVRWNVSPSMPAGLWQVSAFHGPAKRGEVVALCLPPIPAALGRIRGYLGAGDCPDNVEVLLKTVAAISGDRVEVSADGVAVNGVLLRNSRALARDETGRPLSAMTEGSYVVDDGEIWIISGHDPRSYDSRYYGAVPTVGVRGRAVPLLVAAI
jgi:conjugative transfer signal peptidase TraF